MPVKVQKKDGSLQDFDRNKVFNGVIKSGVTPEEAENVTKQVEAWLPTATVDGVVVSMAIREKVLEILRATNPTAAAAFVNYQKPAMPEAQNQPPAV